MEFAVITGTHTTGAVPVHNRARAAAVALVAMAGACGGGGTAPSPTQLAGTWRVTKVEYVSATNASTKLEHVSSGAVYTLTLTSGGSFTFTGTHPGDDALSLAGTYQASVDVLTLNFTSGMLGTMVFDMSLNGNTLTRSGGHAEYDIDGDDQGEETLLNLVFARQ